MKTWTVVIEIKDEGLNASEWTKPEIEQFISESLTRNGLPFIAFQIFECTEAPYGPQGVTLIEAGRSTTILGRAGRVQTAPKEGGK